jgi:hypothetical protein
MRIWCTHGVIQPLKWIWKDYRLLVRGKRGAILFYLLLLKSRTNYINLAAIIGAEDIGFLGIGVDHRLRWVGLPIRSVTKISPRRVSAAFR